MRERLGDGIYNLLEWSRESNREAIIISISIVSTIYLADSAGASVRGAIVGTMMLWLALYVGLVNYSDGLDAGRHDCGGACYDFCFGETGARVASAVMMLDDDCDLVCKPDDEAPM